MAVDDKREGYTTVSPYLVVPGAEAEKMQRQAAEMAAQAGEG